MGNTSSNIANPREPPMSQRAAIWRRLQIWEVLRQYLFQLVGMVPYVPPREPEPKMVKVVEMMLIKALGATGDQPPSHPVPGREGEGEPSHDQKLDTVRAMRAVEKRLVSLNAPDSLTPNPDNPDEEELVAQFFRSSLDIALPGVTKTGRPGGAEPAQAHSAAFSYSEMIRGREALEDADVRSPEDALPAPAQEDLNRTFENFLTWDKRLYANLRLDPQSIRLVEIHPGPNDETVPIVVDLIRATLDEVRNAYEALSYTWGAQTPSKTITVNNIANKVEVKVGMWLFGALTSLRHASDRRRLWVDAICINQASVAERSREVQKMGEIYRCASKVAIFHGWPSRTTLEGSLISALFQFLSRSEDALANGDEDDPFKQGGFDRATVCKGFIDFCCRPWWRRVWTIQEFYLATEEPVWYWGSTGVSNAILKRDFPLLMETSWEWYGGSRDTVKDWIPQHIESSTGAKTAGQFSEEIRRISELIQRRHRSHGFDIPSRLYRSLSARATDPRDLVYGLREVFDPVFRRVFVPDYTMRLQLLYACLAVFLIQFESWGDMLWWYPHRFEEKEAGGLRIPSWLPDFTKRVVPPVTELLPRDHLAVAGSPLQINLVVLNHALHVEGYKLDTIEVLTPIDTGTEGWVNVLRVLWRFEADFNRSRSCKEYIPTEEERGNPVFDSFLKVCRSLAHQDASSIAHPQLPLAEWAGNFSTDDNIPVAVMECLPCWDILMWHAFKVGSPNISKQFGGDGSTETGLLADIFSSRLSGAFRKILAIDFVSDCVFDWTALDHVLRRLKDSSPWSDPNLRRWQSNSAVEAVSQSSNAQDLAASLGSFLAETAVITPDLATNEENLYRYIGLCNLILLDSDGHADFTRIVNRLRVAGEELHRLATDWRTQAHVDDLESRDEIVAARVLRNTTVRTHFSGRSLFQTRQGFHGLTAPGTKPRKGADVLLLNGLSFPMVVEDFNEKEGTGRLVGCAIVRGVDLLDGKAGTPKVPEGCALGEKRLFKFT